MTGKALVCRLKGIQSIEGADRIVQAQMYGETVIISKDYEEGQLGLLFDCETQLSHEYAHANNLYRRGYLNKDENKLGYLEDNRRIRPIRLRGVRCSAMWMPIESMYELKEVAPEKVRIVENSYIDSFEGVPICKRYRRVSNNSKTPVKAKKAGVSPLREHFSTSYLLRATDPIKSGDIVIITEKLHGTSCRCGYLKSKEKLPWWKRLFSREKYDFIVGSRKVIKSINGKSRKGVNHYYDDDIWTKASLEHFDSKLHKGESVYFEIVGFLPTGKPIMHSQSNTPLSKFMDKKEYKKFIERYGEKTIFSYGCSIPGSWLDCHRRGIVHNGEPSYKVFVYRITRELEGGGVTDLSWSQVKRRCEELGVEYVPEISIRICPPVEEDAWLLHLEGIIEELAEDHSEKFPEHLREGVCIRVENGSDTPKIYKHKSFLFKVIEGMIKDKHEDLEESN